MVCTICLKYNDLLKFNFCGFQLWSLAIRTLDKQSKVFILWLLSTETRADNQLPEQRIESQNIDGINLDNPTKTDILKYIEGFEYVSCKLSDYIDPLNKFPFTLAKNKIISTKEAIRIEKLKPDSTIDILDKMVEYMEQQSENCLKILQALIENDQTHIAKFIVSSGKNIRSPDRVLSEEERKAIDGNMFCLEKLVRPCRGDFLLLLVKQNCITANHKDWINNWAEKSKDVYQLFEILKRRSFRHFSDFNHCLIGIGQKKIVDILRKGGVVEITNHLKGVENRSDLRIIEQEIIEKLSGYVDPRNKKQISVEQKTFIDKLMILLNGKDNQIKFVDSFHTNSIALYFQCETKASQKWLVNYCQHEELKREMKILYCTLQPELNSFSKFDLDVIMTNSSEIHLIDTTVHYSAGNVVKCILWLH